MSFTEQTRIALETFPNVVQPKTIRAHVLGYSDSELGYKHPDLPVGFMVRDEGQADFYAGSSRIIASMSGFVAILADSTILNTKQFSIVGTDWYNVAVNHKVINPDFQTFLPACINKKVDLSQYYLLNNNTRVIPNTGEIINKTPIKTVFTPTELFTGQLFDDTPEIDHFLEYMELMSSA